LAAPIASRRSRNWLPSLSGGAEYLPDALHDQAAAPKARRLEIMRVSIPFEARFLTAAIVPPDEAVAKSARIPRERGPRDESERNKSGFINLRLT
jgi:hypothetical protein